MIVTVAAGEPVLPDVSALIESSRMSLPSVQSRWGDGSYGPGYSTWRGRLRKCT
jgi:hypothetical protein